MGAATDNRAIYSDHWEMWQEVKRHGPMSRHTYRLVLKECRRLAFGSVLDVGCGPGIFLERLHQAHPTVAISGLDIADSAIEIASRRLPSGTFGVLDVSQRAPEGRYDLITLIDVAEHLENDQEAFGHLYHACGKYLVLSTIEGEMRSFEPQIGHVRNYRRGELASKLAAAGFEIVRYIRWGWPLYSPLYRNLSGLIAAHEKPLTWVDRWLGYLVYWALMVHWPGRGDLVIAVARPKHR